MRSQIMKINKQNMPYKKVLIYAIKHVQSELDNIENKFKGKIGTDKCLDEIYNEKIDECKEELLLLKSLYSYETGIEFQD